MKDITVIIPTYNRAPLLKKAMQSVLGQREKPAEIIIVDDGSTDHTQLVVEELTCSLTKIKYLYQPNRGPAAARNTGIMHASCDYLAFLDSDDEYHKEKLAVQFQALRADPEFLVSHTLETWYRRGVHLNQKKIHMPAHGNIFKACLRLCCVGMSTVMVRRELFERYGLFNEALRCCEDYDLWLRVSSFEPFLLIDRRLTIKHGGRPDQVSNAYKVGMDRFRIQALAELIDSNTLTVKQNHLAIEELVRKCGIYANGCLKHDKGDEADHYLKLAYTIKDHYSDTIGINNDE